MSAWFYTLNPPKNFTLRLAYKKAGLPPMRSLRTVLKALGWSKYKIAERVKLVDYPTELSVRELAFVAQALNLDTIELIEDIAKGVDRKNKKDWKRINGIENLKHAETKERFGQTLLELKAAGKQIAQLRNVLHEKGIQDPTIQVRKGTGGG